MDHEITCPYMLCYAAYAWLSSRFVFFFADEQIHRKDFFNFKLLFLSSAVAYKYFFSSQIRRSIVYGDQPRNRSVCELNIILPSFLSPRPIVVCWMPALITSLMSETVDVLHVWMAIRQAGSVFTKQQWWHEAGGGFCDGWSLDYWVSSIPELKHSPLHKIEVRLFYISCACVCIVRYISCTVIKILKCSVFLSHPSFIFLH